MLWSVWIFDGLESRHAAKSAGISKGTLIALMEKLFPEFNAVEAEVIANLDRRTRTAMQAGLRTMVRTVEELSEDESATDTAAP